MVESFACRNEIAGVVSLLPSSFNNQHGSDLYDADDIPTVELFTARVKRVCLPKSPMGDI